MTNTIKAHSKVVMFATSLTWINAMTLSEAEHSNHRRHDTTCSYCGSISPTDLVRAIQDGAKLELADFKYGWPHKIYVNDIPNRFVGLNRVVSSAHRGIDDPMPEDERLKCKYEPAKIVSRIEIEEVDGIQRSKSTTQKRLYERIEPESPTTWAKFYTEHLLDATEDEKRIIETAIGLSFTFDEQGGVRWNPVVPSESQV